MECIKCGKSSEEVKLVDVVSNEEILKICELCALSEDAPIIRRPSTSQLKESERKYTVRERLRRMAGLVPESRKEAVEIAKKIMQKGVPSIAELQKAKTKEEELKEKYELAKRRNKPLNLVDNFNWHIFMARRKKKLTRHELAELLGESETAMKMIENKEFPDDSERLIRKIEQFFDIKLRKEDGEEERIEEAVKERLGNFEKKLEIPEKIPVEIKKERREPARILKIDKETVKNLTIADLQRMKQETSKSKDFDGSQKSKISDELEKEKLEKQKKMKADELMKEIEEETKKKEKEEWREEANKSLVGDDLEID